MKLYDLENIVIECLKENLELSGEEVPELNKDTKLACDLEGFDSLRTIEVIVSIEEKIGCNLPPDELLSGTKLEDITVSLIAKTIDRLTKET